jgi:ribose/xylose/arabinose/galactoside ABC-type transport system permease subunit
MTERLTKAKPAGAAAPGRRPPRGRVPVTADLLSGRSGALIILAALIIAFFIATPDFLTADNSMNVLRQYSVPAILAAGQTLVIVARGIDLSVASNAALSGSIMAVAYTQWGLPEYVSILIGLGTGCAVGFVNGFVITRWNVPDFVATLGAYTAVRGVALLVTDGYPVPRYGQTVEGRDSIPPLIGSLGADSLLGVPYIVLVALACFGAGALILGRTTLGRTAYAIGGNPEAARISGIRVGRAKLLVYVFSGLMAAIAGMMLTGRQASANGLMGQGMELQSIAAVVVGGTPLFGGEGAMSGTLIGVLVIGVLANGLTIVGLSEFWQQVINGLVIVLVVALDQWRRRALGSADGSGTGGTGRSALHRLWPRRPSPSSSPADAPDSG